MGCNAVPAVTVALRCVYDMSASLVRMTLNKPKYYKQHVVTVLTPLSYFNNYALGS